MQSDDHLSVGMLQLCLDLHLLRSAMPRYIKCVCGETNSVIHGREDRGRHAWFVFTHTTHTRLVDMKFMTTHDIEVRTPFCSGLPLR